MGVADSDLIIKFIVGILFVAKSTKFSVVLFLTIEYFIF